MITIAEEEQSKLKSFISINLKKLIKLANINASELSKRTGIKQPIIHRLIAGENLNPTIATLKPIADYFMITISELLEEREIESVWHGLTINQHTDWNKVPLISWDQILKAPEERQYSKYALVSNKVNIDAYALSIEDNSMEPVFSKKCIVIIHPNQRVSEFDYVLVNINEDLLAIRHYLVIAGKKYISPLNKNSGEISRLLSEDNILGVVAQIIYERRIIEMEENC